MEKICIVKRRTTNCAAMLQSSSHTDNRTLSIALTPGQTDILRTNNYFRQICGEHQDQVLFNFHFSSGFSVKMIKAKDVCDMLQVSTSTLSKLTREGAVKSYKIGRLRRFALEDILEYLSGSACSDTARTKRFSAEIVVMPKKENETLVRVGHS